MLSLLVSQALAGPAIAKATIGYPPGGEGDPTCRVHLVVDTAGESTNVIVSECPIPFARRCQDAMAKWRWEADGSTFIEERTVRFKQASPYGTPSPPTVLEESVATLIADVHHSELRPAERIPPKFPVGAEGESGKCKGTIVVPAEGGVAQAIRVGGCEEVFHKATRMALQEWDFAAVEVPEGTRWVRSKIALVFDEPTPDAPLTPDMYEPRVTRTTTAEPTFPAQGKKYSPATCTAEFTITETGKTRDIEVRDCEPLFHVAAENAVQRWTYTHTEAPEELRVVAELTFLSKRDRKRLAKEAR